MIYRQFDKLVRVVRSDNGSEFLSMTTYFQEQGIHHETSCVGTPQQNGRVERKHRHILNVARAILFQGHFPIEFWAECVLSEAYLINRTPSVILQGKTPYEVIHGKQPAYEQLRVLGSLCYIHNRETRGDKFESRSRKCVLVGYPYGKKGWRVFDLEKQLFSVSRDVIFDEDVFPFSASENVISMTEDHSMGPSEAPFVEVDAPQSTPIISTDTVTTICSQEQICDDENDVPMQKRLAIMN